MFLSKTILVLLKKWKMIFETHRCGTMKQKWTLAVKEGYTMITVNQNILHWVG